MGNEAWFRLAAVSVAATTAAVCYLLFPEAIREDAAVAASVSLCALTAGYAVYCPVVIGKKKTNTSRIASVGVITWLCVLLLLVAASALYMALNKYSALSLALDAVWIGMCIVAISVAGIAANVLDRISGQVDFKSSHSMWAQRVNVVANACEDEALSRQIAELAEKARMLSRDLHPELEVNRKIGAALTTLETAVSQKNQMASVNQIRDLERLFAQRDVQLKYERSKV